MSIILMRSFELFSLAAKWSFCPNTTFFTPKPYHASKKSSNPGQAYLSKVFFSIRSKKIKRAQSQQLNKYLCKTFITDYLWNF